MGLTALVIATLCYAVTAIDLAIKGDALVALVFACYATANAALTRLSYAKEIDAIIRSWL